MKAIVLDITRRLQAAGFFTPAVMNTVQASNSSYEEGPKVYVSGNSQFEDLELKYGSTVLKFANQILTKEGSLGNIFAPPPLITYEKSKVVEITQIDGTDAEVVERYGDGQWDILIEGILVDMENHQFPITKVKELRKFFEIQDAIEVSSELLTTGLEVQSVWFKSIRLNGVAGFPDTFYYSIPARSIVPVEFYLNDEQ